MARRPDISALREATRAAGRQELGFRLRAVDVPMARGMTVRNEWPWPEDGGPQVGAVAGENAIYWKGPKPGRMALAHEAAHLFDHQALTDQDRQRFMRIMGMKPGQWRAGTGLEGTSSPSEQFADWMGNLTVGNGPRRWESAYASPPGLRRLVRFGETLERIGRRRGLADYQAPQL